MDARIGKSRLHKFGEFLNTQGYDIDLTDDLWIEDYRYYEHKTVDIFELCEEYAKQVITEYTEFLLKHGYCDSDVYAEEPTAINRFYHPKLR